nr:hypothetical protein [Tanacetum cinerariifolium]
TREVQITATIDGKVKLVFKASIRRHLKLEDSDGISTLPNTKIFKQLALMGPVESHHTPSGAPTPSQTPLSSPSRIPTRQETKVPQPSSPTYTHVADEAASTSVDVRHGGAAITVTSLYAGHNSELTVLCTTLSQKVESLEADLKPTKQVYEAAYTKLIMKVKRLEKTVKTSKARRQTKIVVSDDDEEFEDPSKQGRNAAKVHTYTRKRRAVNTGSGGVSTASRIVRIAEESVSTAGASMPVSTVGMINKGKGIMEESEPVHTKTKRQQEQERIGLEAAVTLQEQFDEKERQRIARVHEAA